MVTVIILLVLLTLSILFNLVFIRRLRLYEAYIMIAMQSIRSTYFRMKDIDDRGVFQSDDEVGSTFSELVEVVNQLYDIVDVEIISIEEDTE